MNTRRVLAGIALVVILAGGFWLVRQPAAEPVVIGMVAGLTGKFADLGIDVRRGAEIAIAEINASGGVSGHLLELVALDDSQDEAQAKKAVEQLLAMRVPVIVGHATSSMSMATLPLVNGSETLLVSPTTSTPLLSDKDDNFIRSCAVSEDAATMMARYLLTEVATRSVGVLYDLGNKAYTEMWVQAFTREFFALGGERVESGTFNSQEDGRFLPLVQDMQEKQVEALVIVANSVDGAMISQQVRKLDWQIPLALSDWAATEQLINLGGMAVEGAVISQFFNRYDQTPAYLAFREEFLRLYKTEPGFGALHAYNALWMVATAMRGQQPGESLKDAILRIADFKGLQQDITINRFGDSNHPTYMGVIEDGAFRILEDFR